MAHGIYLEDKEIQLVAARGSSIAHCPESNTNLKSGLCDVRKLCENDVTVCLGTGILKYSQIIMKIKGRYCILDVSGGAIPSIVNAMRSAIQTSIHISYNEENYNPLNYSEVFYLATLGGAKGEVNYYKESSDTLEQ